jgi:hypothetical protein
LYVPAPASDETGLGDSKREGGGKRRRKGKGAGRDKGKEKENEDVVQGVGEASGT